MPVEGWTEVLDASQFGRTCPVALGAQVNPDQSYENYTNTGVEEDCLFLNVYTPIVSYNSSIFCWQSSLVDRNCFRLDISIYYNCLIVFRNV